MLILTTILIFSYLIGSVCTAILVCKALNLPDPRSQGSNNPGATNVMRIGGKKAALITLLGDLLKGLIPVLIAHLFHIQGFGLGLVALAALLGHIFPFFFEFKGGKGVATGLGAILALSPMTALLSLVIWCVVFLLTSYVSLASLVTASIVPLLILSQLGLPVFVPIFFMSALLFWRHRENIKRLKADNESKTKLF